MTSRIHIAALLAVALAAWGCEPGSITEAEQQLGRKGARSVMFTLPVLAETLTVDSILDDLTNEQFDVLPGGLLGYTLDPESLSVTVGDELRFTGLDFDPYQYTFDQALETTEVGTTTSVTFAPPAAPGAGGPQPAAQQAGQIHFATPDGSDVVAGTTDTGTVFGEFVNGTNCSADVTVTLKDSTGATIVTFPTQTVPASGTVQDSSRADGVAVSGYVAPEIAAVPLGLCTPTAGQSVNANITFRPMTLLSVTLENVTETFNQTYDALASEPGIRAVDTVIVETGSFTVTGQNKLPVALAVDLSLGGTSDPLGQPIAGTLNLPAAPGDGSTVQGQLVLDLSGATVVPESLIVSVDGTATAATAVISQAVTTNAVVVDATGDLEIAELRGTLDPTVTSELTVSVEESSTLDVGSLDLGDLEDVVREAELETVELRLVVDNEANVPVRLANFQLGAVRVDPVTGQPQRDPGTGDYVFEKDTTAAGQPPILVDTTISIARSGQTTVVLADSATVALMNRLIDLVIDDVEVAVVAVGDAVVGDGSSASITSTDIVSAVVTLQFGIDFTIDAGGVTFETNTVQSGLELDSALGTGNGSALADRIDSASVILQIQNGTPFAVQAVVVVAPDSIDLDIANPPAGSITLDTVAVAAPTVDANGFVVAPATSTVTVTITGEEAEVFFGSEFTAGIEVILKPPAGGRGAIRGSDEVIVDAAASVVIRTGGSQ